MTELIFVYKANGDLKSKVLDYTHKLFSPSTFQCHLCAITHHNFGKRRKWDDFLNQSKLKISVYYQDEFSSIFPELQEVEVPVVFRKKSNDVEPLIGKNELEKMDLDDLILKLSNVDA